MSEDQLIQLIYKTIRQWADEEAEENDLSEYECEERYSEMLDDIGKQINWEAYEWYQRKEEEYQNETNIQKTNNNTSSSIFSDTILFSKGVNRMMIEYCMYCDTQLTEGFPEFEDCTTLLCDNCGACIDIWHPTKEYEDAQIRSNKKLYD